jgi:UDP-N-acetylglucosamine 2-epimerase (non-hydrolysing)
MKIMSVVGARPNFMKAAPIIRAIKDHNDRNTADQTNDGKTAEVIQHILLHTGQHYDRRMSDSFFADLDLPEPDYSLGVGSGSHAVQTAEIMAKFEAVLLQEKPDALIVVGDVNSTLACALVAAKVSFDGSGARPVIAHVEAGLRSFDRTMPEEINRILTDRLSDLLFVTEESGLINLAGEGTPADRVFLVGNTMIDSLLTYKHKAEASTVLSDLGLRHGGADGQSVPPYALVTLHRPGNVDNREAFVNILEGLRELAAQYPVVFPAHPRTQKRITELGLEPYFSKMTPAPGLIHMVEPLGYLDFLCLMMNARIVVTDSGGIQEETTCLRVPCVTVRDNTERPVTLTRGTNVLAGVQAPGIRNAIRGQLEAAPAGLSPDKWDGEAGSRIVEILAAMRRTQMPDEAPLEPAIVTAEAVGQGTRHS